MKRTIALLSASILVTIGFIKSTFSLENPEKAPLQDYVIWLEQQPKMTRILNLPSEEYLDALQDQDMLDHDAALEHSPSYQSFTNYWNAHKSLFEGTPYLAEIYPSAVFLKRLNDLLIRHSDTKVPEVSKALERNDGSAEKIQAASEAFLKLYWSKNLKNKKLKALLKRINTNNQKDLMVVAPALTKAVEIDEADAVINYYDALISHSALENFKKYLSTSQPNENNAFLETDTQGNTALHYLAYNGSAELIKTLPENVVTNLINQLITRKNSAGDTPLHLAIKKGHEEFALFLLTQTDVPFEEENNKGQTPLSLATQKWLYRVSGEILKKKAGKALENWW